MDEKNNNRYFEPCDECCNSSQTKPNNCNTGCCKPAEYDYVDIQQAKCIPILAQRIYDCENVQANAMRYINLDFNITSTPPFGQTYTEGAEICINKIAVTYDFIGISSDTLPVIIDTIGTILFGATGCSVTCESEDSAIPDETLYNRFSQDVDSVTNISCRNKGQKSRIVVPDVSFYVCNLRIYAYGKIGCVNFTASTEPYSGELSELGGGIDTGIRALDFIGTICLPTGNNCSNVDLKFTSNLDMDCIKPISSTYDGTGGFEASTLASLAVNLKEYATISEELVVYTTPNGVICNNNCNNTCNNNR
jgi:hypothetical protein